MAHDAMSLMLVIAVSLVLTIMAGTVAIDRASRVRRSQKVGHDARSAKQASRDQSPLPGGQK